jgi:hypothetical protein
MGYPFEKKGKLKKGEWRVGTFRPNSKNLPKPKKEDKK